MRRFPAGAALASAALLAVPATAQVPGDPVKVDPAVAGKASHLIVDVRPGEDAQAQGRTPQSIVLAAAQGFKFDPRARAERCSPAQAKEFKCPAASRIGTGLANATVSNGALSQAVTIDVRIFLAPPPQQDDAGGAVLEFTERSSGRQATTTGRIVRLGSSGPYGLEVRFEDLGSAGSAVPQGFTLKVERVQADVGAFRNERVKTCCKTVRRNGKKKKVRYYKKVRRDLIRNPRTCAGTWPYQVRVRYSATEESMRDGSLACSPARR